MKKSALLSVVFLLAFALLFGCVAAVDGDSSNEPSDSTSSPQVSEDISNEISKEESLQGSLPDDASTESEENDMSQEISYTEKEESSEASEDISAPADEESTYIPPEESSAPPEESSAPPEESSEQPPEESSVPEEIYTDAGDAEFIPSGYLLYDGAAYSQAYFNKRVSQRYADAYVKYTKTFPGVRITAINHPANSINIKNPYVQAMLNDQGKVLDDMASVMYGDVNYINLRSTFEKHKGEYLFFKSDFHWTQLGAYYTYCEYAKSIGLTPTPLSAFEDRVLTTEFIGLTNIYAQDERVNTFYDTLHAYMPRKKHTYTIYYDAEKNIKGQYDTCVHTNILTYSCFLIGDQPYAEIVVPENDQSKVVLVIKESSGNAFVPFLIEHYGKIIVIDPRHIDIDIRPLVKNEGVDDIILFATASTSNGDAYCNYYLKLIGE
ncbi:MAG: hypothetical protein E7674_05410 [Ruminococcaceae bacterium]|nr:hypothetical protein [Oscillospiraceae bacterium]